MSELQGIARFEIREGKLEEFKENLANSGVGLFTSYQSM